MKNQKPLHKKITVLLLCGDPADMSSLTNSLLTLQIDQINIKPRVVFKFVLGY